MTEPLAVRYMNKFMVVCNTSVGWVELGLMSSMDRKALYIMMDAQGKKNAG